MKCQVAWTQCTCVGPYKAVLSCQIAKTWGEQTIWNQCHPRQFYQASVFFTVAVKGQYMEDLLGSLLLTTVSQNEPKISLTTWCTNVAAERCFNERAGEWKWRVADTPTVLDCAMNFVEAADETLKSIAWPVNICFTNKRERALWVAIRLKCQIWRFAPSSTRTNYLPKQRERKLLNDWRNEFGRALGNSP